MKKKKINFFLNRSRLHEMSLSKPKTRKNFSCSICGPCSGHTKRSHNVGLVNILSLGPQRMRHHIFGSLLPRFDEEIQHKIKDEIANEPLICLDWKASKGKRELMMYCPGRQFICLILHFWSYIEAHKLPAEAVFFWALALVSGQLDSILTDEKSVPSLVMDYKEREKLAETPHRPNRNFSWNRPLHEISEQLNTPPPGAPLIQSTLNNENPVFSEVSVPTS
jgi:hypothetical protein